MKHQNSQSDPSEGEALDQGIDAMLRARYGPPATDAILEGAGVTVPGGPSPLGTGLAVAAAAAAVLLAAFLLMGPSEAVPTDARVTEWISNYDEISSGASVPMCTCEPGCETFAEHCHNAFARALNITGDAAVELLGESCCDTEEGSVTLAARCDGETVCLIVLLREAAPRIHAKLRRGLSIHRRDFGELSAFEVSELPEPAILPHLVAN